MTKLRNAEDAVEQAIEGGYLGGKPFAHYRKSSHQIVYQEEDYVLPKLTKTILEAMSDPLFWQALSKARGDWKDAYWGGFDAQTYGWRKWAHQWLDDRLLGHDETIFWQSLP